jgi:hypothetical protein
MFLSLNNYSQELKTTVRPDGNTIKYFNPKPIIIQNQYEVGAAVYKNTTTGIFMLNLSILFKTTAAKKISGKLTIQTEGKKAIVLKLLKSEQVDMNGFKLTTAFFEIDKSNLVELKKYNLKSLNYTLDGKIYGSTITLNKNLLINQIKLLQ